MWFQDIEMGLFQETPKKMCMHGGMTLNKCDQCPYQTKNLLSARRHKQYKHEGSRYLCDQCDTSYSANFKLLKHIESKHADCYSHKQM